jgi:hypothetical protein
VLEPIPDVEWWDKGLLAHGSYEQDVPEDINQPVAIKDNKVCACFLLLPSCAFRYHLSGTCI